MATSQETVTSEKQGKYDLIIKHTPDWQEARDAAERDDHQNAGLNMRERDAFAPINRLLEEIVELNLNGSGHGE